MPEERKKAFFNRLSGLPGADCADAAKLSRAVDAVGARPGQVVLDAGCGTGILVPFLLEKVGPSGRVYALDYASGMIARLAERGFPENVEPVLADVHDMPFPDGFFDHVFANACYPHFTDRRKALREIARVTRPGGRLMVCHAIGRRRVNEVHRRAHPAVSRDLLPGPAALRLEFASSGFSALLLNDETDFFLALLSRQGAADRNRPA